MMTREQIIAELAEDGFKVTTTMLRYWEQRGILPKPVKRRHDGATRAVYPPTTPFVILCLRRLQDMGLSLDDIRHLLPSYT